MESTLMVINPVSGRQRIKPLLCKVADLFCRRGFKLTVFVTSGPGDAAGFVRGHCGEAMRVVCCGGDGTLNEVFAGLMDAGARLPVGYIPTGTTNDFASSLGLSKNIGKAAEAALGDRCLDIDLGRFGGARHFSYVASFGAFTNASYKTPQWLKNALGRPSYLLYGVSSIKDIRAHGAKIIADGREIEGDFIFGSVTNSTFLGGFRPFRDGVVALDDGLFELLLVRAPRSPGELQSIFDSMLKRSYGDGQVALVQAREISFEFSEPVPWTLDGEFAGELSLVSVLALRKAARIVA